MNLKQIKSMGIISILCALQIIYLTNCGSKKNKLESQNLAKKEPKEEPQLEKIGFLGMNLGEEIDSFSIKIHTLIENGELQVLNVENRLGRNADLKYFHHFNSFGILNAEVEFWIANDGKRSPIILVFSHRLNEKTTPLCDKEEVLKLFGIYKQKYGEPKLITRKDAAFLMSVAYQNYNYKLYERLEKNEIYVWEKGKYVIFFDLGSNQFVDDFAKISDPMKSQLNIDWTYRPIIVYSYSDTYFDELFDKRTKNIEKETKEKI